MGSTYHKIVLLITFPFLIYYKASGQQTVADDLSHLSSSISSASAGGDEENIGRGIIEVAHGQAFVKWNDAWAWIFCTNYLYPVRRNLAFGGGVGLQFDYTGLYPVISLNSIIGKKSDGFAFGADAKYLFTKLITTGGRVWITGGVYYKDFFVKMMPTFLFGYPKEWYFEAGYSFTIGR
jgi:hypothetical protein